MWSGESGTVVRFNKSSSRSKSLNRLKRLERFERFKRTIYFSMVVLLLSSPALAEDRLYYFWSFSMPEESIKSAFLDGGKVGLVAVLRGLPEGSARESLLRLKNLIGDHQVEVMIDPILFRIYDITAVPTLVYAEEINSVCEHCEPAEKHWKVTGNITLRAALENLARSAPAAESYLQKLKEGFYTK
jgi:type-F conjugative transfer system pilin assembly protein TrbC